VPLAKDLLWRSPPTFRSNPNSPYGVRRNAGGSGARFTLGKGPGPVLDAMTNWDCAKPGCFILARVLYGRAVLPGVGWRYCERIRARRPRPPKLRPQPGSEPPRVPPSTIHCRNRLIFFDGNRSALIRFHLWAGWWQSGPDTMCMRKLICFVSVLFRGGPRCGALFAAGLFLSSGVAGWTQDNSSRPRLSSPTREGNQLLLQWSGGSAPFSV